VSAFIDAHRARFGVEPICRVLAVAPSSYYAARSRSPSARVLRDAELRHDIRRVHEAHYGVYGSRKVWHQLRREGVDVGRDRVARLMAGLGLRGVTRTRTVRTTHPAAGLERPADLVGRVFSAPAPDRLWVADITYVRCGEGFCYTAFVTDAFARRIVGWRVAATLGAELALDALEMAAWARRGRALAGLVHHSDRGTQGRLKGSSQRCLVRPSVGARRALRRASSSQGSCGAAC
jgi:putative transposase